MYLMILEDDEIRTVRTLSEGDFAACDGGILSIIDLGPENPKEYYEGEWHDIKDGIEDYR